MTRDLELQRGIRHHEAGQLAEAETIYRALLRRQPNDVDALRLLGCLACQTSQFEAGISLIRRAIALQPSFAEAHNALGNALLAVDRLPEALDVFREAIRLQPENPVLHYNLGNTLKKQRQYPEAIAAFQRALEIAPDSLETLNNLGNALKEHGRGDEAIDTYRRAIALQPEFPHSHYNLGVALMAQGKLDDAAAAYREAVRCEPAMGVAHVCLGNVLKDQGRIHEAIDAFRRGAELDPGIPEFHSNLAYTLNFDPAADPASILAEARRWDRRYAEPLAGSWRSHENDPSPDRRLRIGYVSADFRNHPIGNNILPLLREHDHDHFEIFLYSAVTHPDELTETMHPLADHWRDLRKLNHEQAAEIVRQDEIDILVDLTLHMEGSRLLLFARKPAPVQVTYLGYCGTTGLSAMDYRLSDPYLDPPGADSTGYSEETIRLATTYWCYDPRGPTPEAGPLPARQSGAVTFGSLNNFAKVSPAALDLWSELLAATPGSRLIVHAPAGSCREAALQRLVRGPVAADRIEFVKQRPWELYLQTWQKIDIALDPFPYGGGITTLDALWIGVPVISLAGRTAVSRGGRSILSNVGLPDLAVDTPQQYLDAALSLAADLPRLGHLRATLRERMEQSPLRDAKAFARDVEAAWRAIWRKWCKARAR